MGERVFIGSCAGRFYAVDRHTGAVAWDYDTAQDGPAASFHGDPLVSGGRIVVGADVPGDADGHLYCFDLETGEAAWKHPVPGGVISRIVSHGDRVYGVSKGGDLLCVGLADGALVWRASPDAESDRRSLPYDVVIHDDHVVYSSVGGKVTSVAASDGATAWAVTLAGDVNTGLVLHGGQLWVGTLEGGLYRIDAADGGIVQEIELGRTPYGRPVVLDDSLLLLLDEISLARVSAADGGTLWQLEAADEWSSHRPKLHDGLVWVGDGLGDLVGVTLADGKVARTLSVGGVIRGFLIADDTAYVGTLRGMMHARPLPRD